MLQTSYSRRHIHNVHVDSYCRAFISKCTGISFLLSPCQVLLALEKSASKVAIPAFVVRLSTATGQLVVVVVREGCGSTQYVVAFFRKRRCPFASMETWWRSSGNSVVLSHSVIIVHQTRDARCTQLLQEACRCVRHLYRHILGCTIGPNAAIRLFFFFSSVFLFFYCLRLVINVNTPVHVKIMKHFFLLIMHGEG